MDGGRTAGFGRRELLRRGLVGAGVMTIGPRLAGSLVRPVPVPVSLGEVLPIVTSIEPPTIITRAEWGADETLGDRQRNFAPLVKAVVHHTAIDTPDPSVDPAGQMRAIQRQHTIGNGWSDLAYHFAIDPAGRVYEGRWARDYLPGEVPSGEDLGGGLVIGAHVESHNTGTLGVVLLGTYMTREPTEAAVNALAHVIAWKFGPRDLDPEGSDPYTRVSDGATVVFANICGHRDVRSTSCPGDRLYLDLPDLRGRVVELVRRGLVGYRLLGGDGSLWNYGSAPSFKSTADIGDVRRNVRRGLPVRTAVGTPSGDGVWVADSNGGVFAFGDAVFAGSLGAIRLNQPIVGMAATPSGQGYWLVASDGGIFSLGDAVFLGSTGAVRLNKPIVGMAATPSGQGYWLVASDGGIFSFGDAAFLGSTGAVRLRQPIVAMATAPAGDGYWLLARDGGIFTFGTAGFFGSGVERRFTSPATAIAPTPSGQGYWILNEVGGVHGFGDAPVFGAGVTAGSRPALALVPVFRP